MITGKSISELAAEIERQSRAMQDYIVPSSHMEMTEDLELAFDADAYPVTSIGHETISSRLGIPAKYYDRMRDEAPALLARNVNTWLAQEGEQHVSRMVRTLDGGARAVLSDKYKRLDNYEFLNTVLPVLMDEHKMEVPSSEVTERRLYVQITFPGFDAEFSVTRGGAQVGEVIRAGVILKNSEVGYGAREISFLAYTLACKNGLVLPRSVGSFSTRHVGARLGNGATFALSSEAQQADAHAFALATRDAVRQMVSRDALQSLVDSMTAAHGRKITGNVEQSVKALGKSYSLPQGEQDSILRHLIDGGDLSHYGLTNAITRTAEDAGSYDRAIELQEIGGVFLHMPERQLEPILAA